MYKVRERTLEAYHMRRKGYSWKFINYQLGLGVNTNSASTSVRYFCKTRGIPFPRPTHDRQELAYYTRKQCLPWKEVAEKCKYSSWQSAKRGARFYAERHNQEWPIKLGVENES